MADTIVAIQSSFAKGEVAPGVYGRIDTAMYASALRTARNVTIRAFGGASNRPGLTWVGPVKTHSDTPRIIEFQFKTSDTYLLEFGNQYMRVVRNDGHVTETPLVITAITAANPPVVTSASHGYSNGDEVFITGVVGMGRVNNRRFLIKGVTTNTFTLADQVTDADIQGSAFPAYVSGGTVARIYQIVTPYAIVDTLLIKYVQSADAMTLTHPLYGPRELKRTGHAAWTITTPTFAPSIAPPIGAAVGTGGASTTRRYRVTATAVDTLEESLPGLNATIKTITAITQANPGAVTCASHGFTTGDEVQIDAVVGMTQLNGRRFTITSTGSNTFTIGEDTTAYAAYVSGGTAAQTFVRTTTGASTANDTITWTAEAGAANYSVYLESNGIFGWLGDTQQLTFTNANLAPNLSISPPSARNPFFLAGDFPAAVSYYQQRRVMGGSLNKPDTSFYSQTASQANFSSSSPTQDDDAITVTLTARKVNEIRHYIPGDDNLVFTSGSEWQINQGSDSAFTAGTLKQHPQSEWGASHNAPIVIGKTILYVCENAAVVRTMSFSWQVNGYTGQDVSLLSSHLFNPYTIVDWTFARYPDPIGHIVRSDGKVCTITYNEEQQMTAWTRWDTQGKFERTASLRHSATEIDEAVYFVVRRVVNGNIVRYIERTHSRRFTDVRDCFFVDAGLSYDSPVSISNVSLASPCVVTAASHGFTSGDMIDLFDIEWIPSFDDEGNEIQPDQLNTERFTATVIDSNTFSIAVDSSAFAAYVEGGTARKAVTTVSGYDHLEGSSVVALCDGNVVSNLTVTGGAVTLPRPFSRVHLGLPFISDVETLDIELPGGAGSTLQGALTKINHVTVRFEKSRGLFIGPDNLSLIEMKQREDENMGDPTALLTGDKNITLDSGWGNGRIFMRQKYPLPMTILAVIPDLTVGGGQ